VSGLTFISSINNSIAIGLVLEDNQ
jgi:hypothetical protein